MMRCRNIFMMLLLGLLVSLDLQAQGNGVESLRQTSKAFAAVARKVSPSVVLIQVERESEAVQMSPFGLPFGDGDRWPFGDDLFKRFFGDRFPDMPRFNAPGEKRPGKQRSVVGQGSGFVFASDGKLGNKTYILTNNQIGVPTIFYPDYYGYPARNTNYGGDIISFDYHPTGLSPLKTQINQLIYVLKNYINGSTSVDYLNYAPSSPTNYITGSASRSLIYQLNANGSIGGKEVIVAINFGNTRLQVDHIIAVRNGIVQGTKFTDILQKSAFPTAVVDGSNRIYIDLPARSYSVWVQGTVSALPVELIDFQAVAQQEGIKLSWTTKSEKNVKSFEVQRSLDAQSFRTIATLSPQGTEGQGATYQYLDVDVPRNEVVYYRLKMNDLDGSVDYSRIKDVRIDDNRLQLSLSPNPTLGNTTLHLNSAEAMVIQIHLYDMAGRQVLHTEHTLRQGDNTFTLPTSQLSGGVYETIISDGVRKWGKRLVKQ